MYTDRLPAGLSKEMLTDVWTIHHAQCLVCCSLTLYLQLAQAGRMLNIADLVHDALNAQKARVLADSGVVERQMKPALSSEMNKLRYV